MESALTKDTKVSRVLHRWWEHVENLEHEITLQHLVPMRLPVSNVNTRYTCQSWESEIPRIDFLQCELFIFAIWCEQPHQPLSATVGHGGELSSIVLCKLPKWYATMSFVSGSLPAGHIWSMPMQSSSCSTWTWGIPKLAIWGFLFKGTRGSLFSDKAIWNFWHESASLVDTIYACAGSVQDLEATPFKRPGR